jgi:hypothetical protein
VAAAVRLPLWAKHEIRNPKHEQIQLFEIRIGSPIWRLVVDILGGFAIAGAATVPDKFDPYREALVMETETVWPQEFDELPPTEKSRLEAQLHANPQACGHLDYIRSHTGFCRQITVTQADVQRLSG